MLSHRTQARVTRQGPGKVAGVGPQASGLGPRASGLGYYAAMSRDPWKLKVFGQADELVLQV